MEDDRQFCKDDFSAQYQFWRRRVEPSLLSKRWGHPLLSSKRWDKRQGTVEEQWNFCRYRAGQEYRQFKLAYHPLTDLLIKLLKENGQSEMLVKVDKGNSVTTHMRAIGKRIWPRRKESITAYTARHAMAADCKSAIVNGADPDLVSKVLGHCVDKTSSFYGNRFQSGGTSVVPSDVQVPREVRQKSKERNERRRIDNKVPSRKSQIKFQPTF